VSQFDSYADLPRVALFGAGKLALGLIAPSIDPRGVRLHIIARPSEIAETLKAVGAFVAIAGTTPTEVALDGVSLIGRDDAEVTDLIGSNETIALLTSVGDGQKAVADYLHSLPVARTIQDTEPLLLIPCENRPVADLSDPQRTIAGRPVAIAKTMVDRICPTPPSVEGDPERVVVRTEAFAEWAVEMPQTVAGSWYGVEAAMFVRSLGASLVGNIAPVVYRKTMLMNGVQACMAALCLDRGSDDLGGFLASDYGRSMINGVSQELAAVVAYNNEVPIAEIEPWRTLYADRISALSDSAERVLKTTRRDVDELRATVHDRIRAPLMAFESATGRPSRYLTVAVEAVDRLLRGLGRA
jgi:hypothetical protein